MMQPRNRADAEAYVRRHQQPRKSRVVGLAFLIAALTLVVAWVLWW